MVLSIKDEEAQDHVCKETNSLKKLKIKEKKIFWVSNDGNDNEKDETTQKKILYNNVRNDSQEDETKYGKKVITKLWKGVKNDNRVLQSHLNLCWIQNSLEDIL